MTTDQWCRERRAEQRQAEEQKGMRDVRAARRSPPPATRGLGWEILANPRVPHAVLEECTRGIHAFIWHEEDLPEGWRYAWGKLDALALTLAGATEVCPALFGGRVLGLCVMKERIILLDEENQRGRPVRDIVQTVVHELCHVKVRNTVHGPQFQRALKSAMAYYDGATDAPAPSSVANVTARPAPRMGVRFRPGGLDSQLEYRG
jgi:hypothetical protein